MKLTPPPSSTAAEDARLRLVVSGVTDYAIFVLSPEGIVCSWNAGAQRFKGYTSDEIIGQHFSVFYTSEDRERKAPFRALHTALTEGRFEDEGWRVRKDGTRFWASVVIDAIRDGEGALIGFAKITRDITERKSAAEQLHASEERFRLLVQGVTDYAIYMLSPNGEITNWNSGARRIKGYEEHEVLNTHFSRFYIAEDVAQGKPMKALATALREGRFESEGWRVRKDGSRFWAHVVIDPIRDPLGQLLGFAKVTRDITERRKANEDLQRATEALFHSQKLEAIGKLTGGVAHDFNNLLSIIVNGLGVLQRKRQDPADARVLDAMARAAGRGAALTQQLLSFARQPPLKQDDYDLNQVIASFEAVLRRASRGGVEVRLRTAAALPLVRLDSAQFESALLNLVVNARDATPDEGVITVRTEAVTLRAGEVSALPAGRYVRVSVQDTGAGMSKETAAKAIEPFFTTKPLGQGTGLGLSQAYGLAQQSNGDLVIESVPGQGSTVSLYFPVIPDQERLEGATMEVRDKALVVDDQNDVLEMAVALFDSMGYEVRSARSGEDALAILQREPDIGVLLTDVVMPGMNGVELAHQAALLAPQAKIILASGYPAAALDEGPALENVEFISKPYTLAQLLKLLRTAANA
jgi:PAS domain S-box-containing protein